MKFLKGATRQFMKVDKSAGCAQDEDHRDGRGGVMPPAIHTLLNKRCKLAEDEDKEVIELWLERNWGPS